MQHHSTHQNVTAMFISQKTIDFIISQEVTSEAVYNRKYINPTWPEAASGVTIGIGYDLGYNTSARIASDWKMLPAADIQLLQSAAGRTGISARNFLQQNAALKGVRVPFAVAKEVFVNRTIPRFAKDTLAIYPGLADLEPDAAGALISMVYNRGNSITKKESDKLDRRKEMREIVPLVAKKDYAGIAQLIDASKRLWLNQGMDGLVKRREKEAEMVRNALRVYAANEKIQVQIA